MIPLKHIYVLCVLVRILTCYNLYSAHVSQIQNCTVVDHETTLDSQYVEFLFFIH